MNPLSMLLNAARPVAAPLLRQGGRFLSGKVDDVLRATPLPGKAQLQRSVGAIEDTVVRPVIRSFSGRTSVPGASGSRAVIQNVGSSTPRVRLPDSYNNPLYTQTGSQRFAQEFGGGAARQVPQQSLRSSTSFPLDDPLTRLQGTSRYLTRQATGAFRNLQNFGPTALNPLAGGNASTRLGKLGQMLNPLNPSNALGLGLEMIPGSILPTKDKAALQGLLFTPGPAPVKALAGLIAYDFNNPFGDGTLAGAPKLTAAQIKVANEARAKQGLPPLGPNGEVNNTQQRPAAEIPTEPVPTAPVPINPPLEDMNPAQVPPGLPPRFDRETPITTPVTPANGNLTTPATFPAPPPDPQLAPTPAENAGAIDPYAYQLQVYGQGRQKASSQESRAAVRDLGLAIHQRLYPQFYADKDNIPTTEVQNPNSMNFKDATRELEASTLAVEELIDPEIIQQLNAMNLRRTGY